MTQVSVPAAPARAGRMRRRAFELCVEGPSRSAAAGRAEASTLEDGSDVVSVAGEVDVQTAPLLAETLDDIVGNGDMAVVVDLTECSFIDSTGLGVLVAVHEQLRESGRRLIVVASDQRIVPPVELTGVVAAFEIYPSRGAVLARARESWADEARRRVSIRGANEQLEQSCVGLGATGEGTFVFICECGDRACTSLLHISLAEYEAVRGHPARFVIARNHENPEAERVVEENGRFGVVETVTGKLSKPARESNPRWQRGEPW